MSELMTLTLVIAMNGVALVLMGHRVVRALYRIAESIQEGDKR